jgi:DNA polymerase
MINKPATCVGCPLYTAPTGKTVGYVPASGTGDNGVLVVLEAAGEEEEQKGIPTVGRAGYFLWQNLKRVGIEREGFRVHNVLSCRPPDNKLIGMWYADGAIAHCTPNLDKTIADHKAHCVSKGKTPVILTLGKFALDRIMGAELTEAQKKLDYIAYPLWNNRYNCFVIAADHPSYLMRGKTELLPVLQFVFQRALEIADVGLRLDDPKIGVEYVLDPTYDQFLAWVEEFEAYYKEHPDLILSYDIETPHKKGQDEETLDKDEDDYTILQCSFAYKPGYALSAKWAAEFRPLYARLFASPCAKVGWNNQAYDDPRIMAQLPINGDRYDGMQMWHVLNSALPKGLGFVTPFYVPTTSLWKYLGSSAVGLNGAFYNAKDSDMALRNVLGIKEQLQRSDLWQVYLRHMVEVHRVFNYMSAKGVKLDLQMRQEAEEKLSAAINQLDQEIQEAVPDAAKKLKVFKKTPKDLTGLVKVVRDNPVKQCPLCLAIGVGAKHFKSVGKKRLKAGESENMCVGLKARKVDWPTELWAKIEPFKLSKASLTLYQSVMKHKPVIITDKKKKEKKVTFDEKAILVLIQKYPNDKLYPRILDFRATQKLLGTYIGVTQYIEVNVPDDYELQQGEKWKDAV